MCLNQIQMVEWCSDGVGSCTCAGWQLLMYCRAIVQACFATFHLHTQLVNVVLKSFIVLYIPYTFLNANVADTSIENTYYVCFPIYNTVAPYHCTNKQWACVFVIIAVVPTLWTTAQPASEDHCQGVVLALCLLRNLMHSLVTSYYIMYKINQPSQLFLLVFSTCSSWFSHLVHVVYLHQVIPPLA